MYLCPTTRPLLMIHSAASGESSQMPRDADVPRGLSFLFSHAISSIWYPLPASSFSSVIFSIPCFLLLSRSKSSVGVRWTTIPKRGFTSFMSLPSSPSHSMLVQATSADWGSLNLITYPVLVVPTPATCASLVVSAFRRADLIHMLARVAFGSGRVGKWAP